MKLKLKERTHLHRDGKRAIKVVAGNWWRGWRTYVRISGEEVWWCTDPFEPVPHLHHQLDELVQQSAQLGCKQEWRFEDEQRAQDHKDRLKAACINLGVKVEPDNKARLWP